jgi:ribonuclease G
VIEQTEAFVSIDVNTGRCTKGRIPEETYRKVNLEAAAEIARQLALRNLSGIILVDFIKLENEDHRDELIHVMQKLVKKDQVRTEAVDLTPLGIMEIVRHKVRKPLAEILGVC